MAGTTFSRPSIEPLWSRRRWMAGLALLGFGALGADEAKKKAESTPDAAEVIRARAKAVGLKNVRVTESEHYRAVGDARDDFRKGAIDVCESLAATFQNHFHQKKFDVSLPKQKMILVTLAGRKSYGAFKGEAVGDAEGGHFDVGTNRLVMFDFADENQIANAKRTNTFALVHEALHQLTYNTGVLARESDVPVAVSEGFATYGELWSRARKEIGHVNPFRLAELKNPQPTVDWIPVKQLLAEDDLFENEQSEQMAYSEAWLLVYEMMQKPANAKRLRAYLDRIRTRSNPGKRVEDAEDVFGNLDRLDTELKRAATRMR